MRDYVLSEALARETLGLKALIRRVARNWKAHRDLQQLLKLEDYLLADMGLNHALVLHLIALPLTVDVDWEKERVLRNR
jgi:uncharacterized protein YjiS (DUF1127 family)